MQNQQHGNDGNQPLPDKENNAAIKVAEQKENQKNTGRGTAPVKQKKKIRCLVFQCPFVATQKHHLQYHIRRKHTGERPFACDKCDYTCITKTMLKSHMKSHSTHYEYHCADCRYKSKYYQTMKKHLKSKGHTQAASSKKSVAAAPKASTTQGDPQPSGTLNLPFLQPVVIAFLHAHYQFLVANYQTVHYLNTISAQVQNENDTPLNLSIRSQNTTAINLSTNTVQIVTAQIESSPKVSGANRHKGKAIKCVRDEVEDGQELNSITAIKEEPVDAAEEPEAETANYYCQHCKICFGFHDLYKDHMRYHTIDDPSKCNLCQKRYDNALSFYRYNGVEPQNL